MSAPTEYNPAKWTVEECAAYETARRYRFVRQFGGQHEHLRDASGTIRWPRMAPGEPWDAEGFPAGMSKRDRILRWLKTEFGGEDP